NQGEDWRRQAASQRVRRPPWSTVKANATPTAGGEETARDRRGIDRNSTHIWRQPLDYLAPVGSLPAWCKSPYMSRPGMLACLRKNPVESLYRGSMESGGGISEPEGPASM